MTLSANTPSPPYYAVIFTSLKSQHQDGYDEMNERVFELVNRREGFLGSESFRNKDGFGVTNAYFKSREAILSWKKQQDHVQAQKLGREKWYDHYKVRICKVEHDYEFNR